MSTLQHPFPKLVVFLEMVLFLLLHLVEHVALGQFLGQMQITISCDRRLERVHNVRVTPIHSTQLQKPQHETITASCYHHLVPGACQPVPA